MSKLCLKGLISAAAIAALPLAAQAGGYIEAVSGDLPNSGLTPALVTLTPGSNIFSGTVGNVGGVDRDYFTFTLPVGWSLTGVITLEGTSPGGTSSFMGVSLGSTMTVSPTSGSAVGLLGWTLFSGGPDAVGIDLLPYMGVPDLGSTGFEPPLQAGSYTFWIQETASGAHAYNFDFTVTAVPEPGTLALWAAGLVGVAGIARRRRSTSIS